jgi:hypothetical protein
MLWVQIGQSWFRECKILVIEFSSDFSSNHCAEDKNAQSRIIFRKFQFMFKRVYEPFCFTPQKKKKKKKGGGGGN